MVLLNKYIIVNNGVTTEFLIGEDIDDIKKRVKDAGFEYNDFGDWVAIKDEENKRRILLYFRKGRREQIYLHYVGIVGG